MSSQRQLIVNADDFGFSDGVSRAIVRAHLSGIVTSTSLMVRAPSATAAIEMQRECPSLDVGLHLDLGEWAYTDGEWVALYEVVDTRDEASVRAELQRQLDAFHSLTGRQPTHIDSHQHVHMRDAVRPIVHAVAKKLGVRLRHVTPGVGYCGDFYGQTTEGASLPERISVDALAAILSALPEGISELACHPGEGDDVNTMYRIERRQETEVLCDPRIRAVLEAANIALTSFSRLGEEIER